MSVSNEQENKTNSSSEKNTHHIIIPSLFDTEKRVEMILFLQAF